MIEDTELDKILNKESIPDSSENASENEEKPIVDNSQDDSTVTKENSPVVITDESESIKMFKSSAISNITKKVQGGAIDVDEGLKQVVNAVSIIRAVEDPKLNAELTKNAAKSLKYHSKSINHKDEANEIDRRTVRNEAFYKAFRPILEFDLSHLIGKRRRKLIEKDPATGRKTIRYEDVAEPERKEYKDRSYGLVVMMLMISLLIVPYCIANIVLAMFNAVNAIFECFTKFGRTAFYLSTSIAAIAIIGLVIYVLLLVVQAAFGVQIFQ